MAVVSKGSFVSITSAARTVLLSVMVWTAALCFWTGQSAATNGGPQVVEVLGFDSRESRVYFTISTGDESDNPPEVHYLSLADAGPDTSVRIWEMPWSRTRLKETMQQLYALRGRLSSHIRPITGESPLGDSTEVYVTVVGVDSVSVPWSDGPIPRLSLDVTLRMDQFIARRKFTAWCRPGGRVVEWLYGPRPDMRLAIFGFVGNPMETCYERQEVVILRRP